MQSVEVKAEYRKMNFERWIFHSLVSLTIIMFFLLILFPFWSLFSYSTEKGWDIFLNSLVQPGALFALWLTIKVALITTLINLIVGTAVAFVLARTNIPGKKVLDALVDIPLAIPTVVIGFALLLLYTPNGFIGGTLRNMGIEVMFSLPGIVLAHVFVTFPFMVRAVGTVLEGLDRNYENAAKTLGASTWQTFINVTLPGIKGGLIAGSVLTFAKSIGEFGATLMVSGNLWNKTQTGPLYIYSRFNTGDIEAAGAVALVLAAFSFIILFLLKLATEEKKEDTVHD